MTDTDEPFWNDPLLAIEKGRVILVVGQDLLTVQVDGAGLPLHMWLEQRLAAMDQIAPADYCPPIILVVIRPLRFTASISARASKLAYRYDKSFASFKQQ